jgi:hypothetical protein
MPEKLGHSKQSGKNPYADRQSRSHAKTLAPAKPHSSQGIRPAELSPVFSRFLVTVFPILLLVSVPLAPTSNGAADSDAAKKKAFLDSQKNSVSQAKKTPPAKKPPIPTSKKPLPPPRPPSSSPTKKPAPKPTQKSVPKPIPRTSPVSRPTPPSPEKIVTPAKQSQAQTPLAAPAAPVVIEKSNELVAAPEPEKRGLFSFFNTKTKGKYITPALRDQINRPSITRGRWKYIVVHNSGTRQGNAKAFEDYHRRVRKMQNGLAYHFVIGNGTSTGDGQIEIGNRWKVQLAGGHVHSDYLNNVGIGICLVGDYNHHKPTQKQLESLEELIRFLRNRVGKSEGKEVVVKPHREINPPRWPTDCPGDQFPYSWLKSRF